MREYLMRRLEIEVHAMVSWILEAKNSADPIDPECLAERIKRLCAAAASAGWIIAVESE